MDTKPTTEELETMAREIRAAADEYATNMRSLQIRRTRLFDTWTALLEEGKMEQIRKQIHGTD